MAGFLHVLGGAAIGAAVSWFAAQIHYQYYSQLAISHSVNWGFTSDNMKMVYGDALFVGWVSRRQSVRIMFPFKSCFQDCMARKAERETCS